ncbi:MAG TPA: hypothetical protein VH186_25775 [Chloroflexia bacterium]|nr:hypothetical protein [Chloroflexia bacterium]
MDLLTTIFLGCFIFGLIFTVASFLLGGLEHFAFGGHAAGNVDTHMAAHGADHAITGGHAHLGAHVHTDGLTHTHPEGHVPGHVHDVTGKPQREVIGWFNLNALVVFLTWFGGAGFILKSLRMDDLFAIPVAIVFGIAGYMAVMLFMSKVLVTSQTPVMRVEDYDLTGTVAKVSGTIFKNGVGEVLFSKHGTRRAVPARSADGSPLALDTQVVILRFENGVAFVDDLNRLLSEAGAEKWSLNEQAIEEMKSQNEQV